MEVHFVRLGKIVSTCIMSNHSFSHKKSLPKKWKETCRDLIRDILCMWEENQRFGWAKAADASLCSTTQCESQWYRDLNTLTVSGNCDPDCLFLNKSRVTPLASFPAWLAYKDTHAVILQCFLFEITNVMSNENAHTLSFFLR